MRDQDFPGTRRRPVKWPHVLAATALAIGILLVPPATAQTLENGDFSRGPAIWKGERKVIADPADPENKVLELTLAKAKTASFHQLIDTDGAAMLTVSFQVKGSQDLAGGSPLTLRMTRPDRSSTWQEFPVGGADWQTVTWTFTKVNGAKKLDFTVEAPPGGGKLYFDNFKITSPGKSPSAAATPQPSIHRPPVTSEKPPAGLWLWADDANVTSIYPDGTAVLGNIGGDWHWIDEAHGLFQIVWRNGKWIDTVTVSSDGNTLHCQGGNSRKFDVTRIRAPIPPADDPNAVPFVADSAGAGDAPFRGYIAGTYSRHNNDLIIDITSGLLRPRDPAKSTGLIEIIPFLTRHIPGSTRDVTGEWTRIAVKQYIHGDFAVPPSRSIITLKPHTDVAVSWLTFGFLLGPDVNKPPVETRAFFLHTPVYLFSETSH